MEWVVKHSAELAGTVLVRNWGGYTLLKMSSLSIYLGGLHLGVVR